MNRLFALAVIALALAAPAAAQDRRGLIWDNRPSIVFGDDINIDVRGRVQLDGRWFEPAVDEDAFDVRTLRFGVRGEFTRHLEWEIEREIEEVLETGDLEPKWRFGEWKDVYIDWRTFDALSVIGGRFKMPFGLEQTTSVSALDFAFRTRGSVKIAPGRDRGVMAYGELLDGSLVYEAGVFDDDGDNGEQEEEQFVVEGQDTKDIGPSFAARVVGEIFRRMPVHNRLKGAEIGVAYTRSSVPEGLNSLKGEDVWGYDFFERVYVNGTRQRLGLQFDWSPGPTGFKAEWMQAREQRLGQSNRDEDLSDLVSSAWYTSATLLVTGEDKDGNISPDHKFGAIEIGARYDRMTMKSASTEGPPFRNPRSEHLLPNSVGTITLGGNWLVNRWVKVVANVMRQSFDDEERTPLTGSTDFWSTVLRLQVAF